jgi:hypothetical protein
MARTARVVCSIYFAGIGISGLYDIYGNGFISGLLRGSLWPIDLLGNSISNIDKLDIITKNN